MKCAVERCDRPSRSHGLCNSHNRRRERHGDAAPDRPIRTRTGPDECPTCAEADFARDFDGDALELAAALDMQPESLRRHFKRHGRPDLAQWARSSTNHEYRYYRI